jgi:uncharacterized protein YegL
MKKEKPTNKKSPVKKKTLATKKVKKSDTTEIICVLDRSTSIRTSGLTDKTIEGFNSFLSEQKKAPGKAKLTLCLFDGGKHYGSVLTLCLFDGGKHYGSVDTKTYEIIHERIDIKDVPELNKDTFIPKGMTAMYDAIGNTIDSVYTKLKNTKNKSKVIFLIMTDGEENSSEEYTQQSVFELIEKRKKKDNWAFLFIGANIDTMKVGGGMGISKGNTMGYTNTSNGVNTAYMNISTSVSMFRGATSLNSIFSDTLLADNGVEKEKI